MAGEGYPKTKTDSYPQYVPIDGSRNMRKVKVTGLTTTQRDALNVGSNDRALIYNNTTSQWEGWNGTSWDGLGASTSSHITIQMSAYDAVVQGTWTYITTPAPDMYGFWGNSTSNDGDEINYKVYLGAGTYTLSLIAAKGTASGILDIDIDGTEVASFDLYYSSTWVFYPGLRQTSISISVAGLKTLTLRLDGKNASSSGYIAEVREISLWRSA